MASPVRQIDVIEVSDVMAGLCEAAAKLGGSPYVMLQGYPFTTFGQMQAGVLDLPSKRSVSNWDLFWDLRAFSSGGEWHAWRDSYGTWRGRLLLERDFTAHSIKRRYVLWGNKVDESKSSDRWKCCTEASGAEVWVPEPVAINGVPVYLIARELVDYQPATGLAGIVDTVLCGFEPAGSEHE